MRRLNPVLLILCLLLLGVNGWLLYRLVQPTARAVPQSVPQEEAPPELAEYMGFLQRYNHKLMLAVQARNPEAAGFYLHEMNALSQTIETEVPMYEGMRVGALVDAILVPELDSLGRMIDRTDWDAIDAQTQTVVQACNDCHRSTGHGFIRIDPRVSNPFNQTFAPASE